MENNDTLGIIIFLGGLCSFGLFMILHVVFACRNSEDILTEWEKDSGFIVQKKTLSIVFKGPFSFNATASQPVFYLTLANRKGEILHGWIKFNSYFFGFFREKSIEVVVEYPRGTFGKPTIYDLE